MRGKRRPEVFLLLLLLLLFFFTSRSIQSETHSSTASFPVAAGDEHRAAGRSVVRGGSLELIKRRRWRAEVAIASTESGYVTAASFYVLLRRPPSFQPGSARVNLARVNLARLGSFRSQAFLVLGSGQFSSGQFGSARFVPKPSLPSSRLGSIWLGFIWLGFIRLGSVRFGAKSSRSFLGLGSGQFGSVRFVWGVVDRGFSSDGKCKKNKTKQNKKRQQQQILRSIARFVPFVLFRRKTMQADQKTKTKNKNETQIPFTTEPKKKKTTQQQERSSHKNQSHRPARNGCQRQGRKTLKPTTRPSIVAFSKRIGGLEG